MIPANSTRIPVTKELLIQFFSTVTVHDSMWHNGTRCWVWTGWRDKRKGYAWINYKNRIYSAHRFSYLCFVGSIEDETLDHLCKVRACVNPSHLEPTPSRVNTLRGDGPTARNSKKTFCSKGHEFSVQNTRIYIKNGKFVGRFCRMCDKSRPRRKSKH
jgi:hypothetical protein